MEDPTSNRTALMTSKTYTSLLVILGAGFAPVLHLAAYHNQTPGFACNLLLRLRQENMIKTANEG